MKGLFSCIGVLLLLPLISSAQNITYSALIKGDNTIDIIGKVSGNILILKSQNNKYAISIYQDNMVLKENVTLDFINSSQAFTVDFIIYRDFFYLIYQYQKGGVVYCVAAKMDGNVKKMNEPVTIDTTNVGSLGGSRVYTVITSEDKQKVLIYKILQHAAFINFVTLLYDDKLQLIHNTSFFIDYNEYDGIYSDFHIDNEGNMIFTRSIKINGGEDLAWIDLITKGSLSDTFSIKNIPLNNWFIDDMKIKVDNVNKRYVLNSFYYVKPQGNIEGIYSIIWDAKGDSSYASTFTPISDSVRKVAKESGRMREAFNEYFIRKIILKNDGGYILIAEDCFNIQGGDNIWHRHYNRSSLYRYYYNILVFSISNRGVIEWSNTIPKKQSDNYFSSFNSFSSVDGLHFLYNISVKRKFLIKDDVISAGGKITRNPNLKNYDTRYDFMIRFAKMTGTAQLIVPCLYRGRLCLAKIDF